MRSKTLKRWDEIRKMVNDVLKLDSASNYDCADAAAESVLSELEQEHEFTPEDASSVCDLVSDWYCENEEEGAE